MSRKLARDEIGQRGTQIYQSLLRRRLEELHFGSFVAIDVESSDYEIGLESSIATERLWERRPDAQVFVERIGFPAAFHAY